MTTKRVFRVPGTLQKASGYDVYGQPTLSAEKPIKLAVVELKKSSQHTTVRTDSGGTHGRADEFVADAKLLIPVSVNVSIDDYVTVGGVKIRVRVVHPRFSALGRLDHVEIEGTIA